MSEIDKVTRLLELATLYRLREEFDLKAADKSENSGSIDRQSDEDPPMVAEKERAEPVGG